jgi:hypothetical protein
VHCRCGNPVDVVEENMFIVTSAGAKDREVDAIMGFRPSLMPSLYHDSPHTHMSHWS